MKRGASLDAARVDSTVLRANLGLLAVFPVLHELCHRVVGQILIEVLIVDLDHWGVHAGAEALNLLQGEQTICAGLVHLHIVEVLDGPDNVLGL